jgi:peptidoglycan/LPS O-acetylase OafA/YrhL
LNLFTTVKETPGQFPALTGMRAIAAFMVFFHHLPLHFGPHFLIGWQLSFYTGVTLFFTLSGFLITWRYYGKIELSGKYAWNYGIKRFARIYPLYFLVLTVVVLLLQNFNSLFLLQNYTLTHTLFFIFPSHGVAIPPSWSLTVEECFYLLAPLIFFLTRRTGLWLPFLLTLLLLLLIIFTYHDERPFWHRVFSIFTATFFGHCIAFYSGIWLALVLLKNKAALVPRPGNAFYTVAAITGLALLFIPLIYTTNKEAALRYTVMVVCNNLLLPLPVALLYYGLAREKTVLQKLLGGSAFQLLGRSSYAFYLVHFPLIHWLATPFIRPYFIGGYNAYVLLVFLLTVGLSLALYRYVEHPLNIWIRRHLQNK